MTSDWKANKARQFRQFITKHRLNNVWELILDSELNLLAVNLAFFTILSLVPFLAITAAVIQTFIGLSSYTDKWLTVVIDYVAAGAGQNLVHQLEEAVSTLSPQVMGISGFIVLVAATLRLLKMVDKAIQRIWGTQRESGLLKNILSRVLIVVFLFPGLAIVVGFLATFQSGFIKTIPGFIWIFMIVFPLLWLLYHWVPAARVRVLWSFICATFMAFILSLSPYLYTWVSRNLLAYNEIYGALAFLPLFLIWVLLIWTLILTGVLLNAILQELFPDTKNNDA